jgi:hypothetical protein
MRWTRPGIRDNDGALMGHGIDVSAYDYERDTFANMLPLTAVGDRKRATELVWRANVALARTPGLRQVATNVEAISDRIELSRAN